MKFKSNANIPIFYWSAEKSNAEIDYIVQLGKYNIPIEVKSSKNLKAKSLKSFIQRYDTKVNIRTSMTDYKEEKL